MSERIEEFEKLNPKNKEFVNGIIKSLATEETPEEKAQRQQEQERRERERIERERHLEEIKAKCDTMTNADYREALAKIFADIHENYKLRWFYIFINAKLHM